MGQREGKERNSNWEDPDQDQERESLLTLIVNRQGSEWLSRMKLDLKPPSESLSGSRDYLVRSASRLGLNDYGSQSDLSNVNLLQLHHPRNCSRARCLSVWLHRSKGPNTIETKAFCREDPEELGQSCTEEYAVRLLSASLCWPTPKHPDLLSISKRLPHQTPTVALSGDSVLPRLNYCPPESSNLLH